MALYRAKAEGRGLTRFYEAAMDEALRQRRQLEADLRLALANGDLRLHYQPLAELGSGAIIGFEALLRWDHPELGAISPEMFVRLAEESGLIVKLGEWVLREACGEAARWTPALSSRSTSRRSSSCRTIWSARSSGCSATPGSIPPGSSSK